MANEKISEFTEVTTLGAEHFIPVVNESGSPFLNEKISKENLAIQMGGLLQITKSLTAAQIKTGNSVPIDTGIPLPSVTQAIEVVSASCKYTFVTTAFTNNAILLITDTAVNSQRNRGILADTANSFKIFITTTHLGDSIELVANKRLMIKANADSATGDGTAKIYILYRIINI